MRMKHRIHKRQLNYICKIENMHWDRWVKKILHNHVTKNFYPKYKDLYKIEQPIKVKRNEFTQTVKRRTEQEANDYYQQEAKEIKKLRDLNKHKRNIKREYYIGELNWKDARTIFKIRTRMTKIEANFKGTSEELICKRCYAEEDSEKYLIDECPMIERKHSSKFEDLLNSASAQNMRDIAKLEREYTNNT